MSVVLLVDDDEAFRALIAPLIARRGHVMLEARTAAEARGILTTSAVDLAVVDALLPDADGPAWLAGLAGGVTCGVIVVTAWWRELPLLGRQASEIGALRVVQKPVVPAFFAAQVEEILAAARPAADSDPELRKVLDRLAEGFRAALPGRIAELQEALERARSPGGDPEDAQRLAHKLRGTAGSYGLHRIGAAAGVVEDQLRDGAPSWPLVAGALREIEAVVRGEPHEPAESAAPPPHGARLLVVDDDTEFRAWVAGVARRHLVAVAGAAGERDAIELSRARAPDAALLDVHLGGDQDAFALARALRALPGCARMPVIFASVDGSAETRVRAAEAGATAFLEKPVAGDELALVIRQMVRETGPRSERAVVLGAATEARAALESFPVAVEAVRCPADLLPLARGAPPDLVVVDVGLGEREAVEACLLARTLPALRAVPVVAVGAGGAAAVRLFEVGADDVIPVGTDPRELRARLAVRLDRARQARERGDHDALTGLLRRQPFQEALAGRISEARRHGRSLALAMLDLDLFKRVNDTWGHLAGDRVLATLGGLLAARLRREDLRARWGGEELAVASPDADAEGLAAALARLLAELREVPFAADRGGVFRVTFSAGVAAFPADGDDVDALLGAADRRLYEAKRTGRDRIVSS
ncbi:MAG: diguanylate cyclase [Myxococcota bacterium]